MAGDLEISAYQRQGDAARPAGRRRLSVDRQQRRGADRLIAVTSPSAGKVEIHVMEIVNDVMTMRPVEGGLEIPAGATVELKPAARI